MVQVVTTRLLRSMPRILSSQRSAALLCSAIAALLAKGRVERIPVYRLSAHASSGLSFATSRLHEEGPLRIFLLANLVVSKRGLLSL